MQTNSKRINWIDWMKTIGMFTIVWGHCFPNGGIDSFLYAFNVPLFFIISGYLIKREENFSVCFNKCLHNLIIPYFILAFIKCAGPLIKHIGDGQSIWSLIGIFGGFHSINGASGCNNLWFVYTLIIIRFIYQGITNTHGKMLIASLLCIVGAWIYNAVLHLELMWAVTNVMLALPFFMLGNYVRTRRDDIINSINTLSCLYDNTTKKCLIALLLLAATYFIGIKNGCADLFQCQYGNSLWMFAIGSICGCMMIFLICLALDKVNWKGNNIISSGSIVILVFHRELLHPMLKAINKLDCSSLTETTLVFAAAVIATTAFIPIILILKRYFPIVLGTRAKNI